MNVVHVKKKAKSSKLRRFKKDQPPLEDPDHADFLIQIFLHRYPDLSKTRDEIKNALEKNPGSFENAYAELRMEQKKIKKIQMVRKQKLQHHLQK